MKRYIFIITFLFSLLFSTTVFAFATPGNGTSYKYYVYYTGSDGAKYFYGSNVHFSYRDQSGGMYWIADENITGTWELDRWNYAGTTDWYKQGSGSYTMSTANWGGNSPVTITDSNITIVNYDTKVALYTPVIITSSKSNYNWTDNSRFIVDYTFSNVPYGSNMDNTELQYSVDGTNFKPIMDSNGNRLPFQDLNGNYISNIISANISWHPDTTTMSGTLSVSYPVTQGTNSMKLWLKTQSGTYVSNASTVSYEPAGTYTDTNKDGVDDITGKSIPKTPDHAEFDGKPDRSNFPDGIMGDIAYYFALLGYYVTMPLRLIKGGFETFINILNTYYTWMNNFASFANTFLSIFPPEVSGLISMTLIASIIMFILRMR